MTATKYKKAITKLLQGCSVADTKLVFVNVKKARHIY